MMPPICTICYSRSNTNILINFKLTRKDKNWQKEMKKEHKIEHPPYAVWFCKDHAHLGKKYQHLAKTKAMKLIKEELESKN